MILHFTDKLRRKLHIPALDPFPVEAGTRMHWYANVFTADRVQYILTTNTASLFSVVTYGRGVTDSSQYLSGFLRELHDHLEDMNLTSAYERLIAPRTNEMFFAKTADRSVLGSMNDMVSLCKHRLSREDYSPWQLSVDLNHTPFKATGFQFPNEVFAQLSRD